MTLTLRWAATRVSAGGRDATRSQADHADGPPWPVGAGHRDFRLPVERVGLGVARAAGAAAARHPRLDPRSTGDGRVDTGGHRLSGPGPGRRADRPARRPNPV